ncbi:hypothetical protein DFH06DRAFT_1226274 [Mycena polygramma]|nr:hypothetical protein DFH06DRAFT_1226274 [Mycena polygramma]
MHRALKIPEVLKSICAHIYPHRHDEPSEDASRDLARLARTCTVLSELALDALWDFQDTIMHILDCMPPGIWRKDGSLRRPILQSDWQRPLRYMRRVRCLSYSDGLFPASRNLPIILETLRLSLPTNHVFPHLLSLRWTLSMSSSLPLVALFLAPGIKTLVLGTFKSISDLNVLAALTVKCPLLTSVQLIQAEMLEIDQCQAIASFVGGLKESIQSLNLRHLAHTALPHLAHLPRLEILALGSPQMNQTDFGFPRTLILPRFAALRQLILTVAPTQSVLTFIRALSTAPLESFTVDIDPPPDTSSTMQIYVALKKHLPSPVLQSLRITSPRISARAFPVEPPAITIDTVRYLFHFHNMTSLALWPPTGIDVDDNAMLLLARALPHLERLSLSARAKAHPLRATLHSLVYLAENCPQLEHLEMGVNAKIVPNINYPRTKRVRQYNLRDWDVADSLIKSSLLVARFLSGIFPILAEISSCMRDQHAYKGSVTDVLRRLWGEVEAALPICHDMRKEERYWKDMEDESDEDECDCTYGKHQIRYKSMEV